MRASECENEIILGLTLIAWITKHAFIYINNNFLSLGKCGMISSACHRCSPMFLALWGAFFMASLKWNNDVMQRSEL